MLTASTDECGPESSPSAPQSLDDIGIAELLEQDSRPTFVIDLQAPEKEGNDRMSIVFCNKALRFFV